MAQQTIAIRVKGKHAETDFFDLVSFNENSYRLEFDFDSEWDDYSQRVAVLLWAGGCREQLFTGTSCDLPAVTSPDCDTAFVGVYSANGAGRRITSSFVRLRCLGGAYREADEEPQPSLHQQILDLLNAYDFSALTRKVTPGSYSAVSVNAYGFVTGGKQIVEVGEAGQTQPSASLADGGIFFRKEEDGYTLCYYSGGVLEPVSGLGGGSGGAVTSVNGQTGTVTISKYDLGLADVALTGSYNDLEDKPAPAAVSSVNGQTGVVTISKYDLGLADVALTGSYNDLTDKPAGGSGGVTSVNGQTGVVTISKHDLGLGLLDNERQLIMSDMVRYGANFNILDETGCYYVQGSSDLPCSNAPTSSGNTAQNCKWLLMTFSHADEGDNIVQLAVSQQSDCAIRIRNYSGGSWCAWKTVI